MNVIMIENLKRKDRSARISVISRVTTRTDPLVFVCLHIEIAMAYSMMLIGYVLLPNSVTEDALFLTMIGQADSFWLSTCLEVCTLIAAGIVAPFYVCSGFSLYINRRTHLEAWDIDLHFRQLIDRQGKRNQFVRAEPALTDQGHMHAHRAGQSSSPDIRDGGAPSVAASMLGIFFVVYSLLQPGADVMADPVPDDQDSHQLINKILEHRDFGVTTTKLEPQFIEREEEVDDSDWFDWDWDIEWWGWVAAIIEFLRTVSSVAVWIEGFLWFLAAILFGAIAYLIVVNSRHLSVVKGYFGFKRGTTKKVQVFDLDIAPKSLPSDIPSAAKTLLSAGQQREAMSLLYRGALSRLVHRYGMEITDSATERQCVELVTLEQPKERIDVFALLTRYWLEVAYGRNGISDEQVSVLCEKWAPAFDAAVEPRGVKSRVATS